MRALLVKNDEWGYVSRKITKPEVILGRPGQPRKAYSHGEVVAVSVAEIPVSQVVQGPHSLA